MTCLVVALCFPTPEIPSLLQWNQDLVTVVLPLLYRYWIIRPRIRSPSSCVSMHSYSYCGACSRFWPWRIIRRICCMRMLQFSCLGRRKEGLERLRISRVSFKFLSCHIWVATRLTRKWCGNDRNCSFHHAYSACQHGFALLRIICSNN